MNIFDLFRKKAQTGADKTWLRERMSKKRMLDRLNLDWEGLKDCSAEEKREYRRRTSKGYYDGV